MNFSYDDILLKAVIDRSTFFACRATNDTLAEATGVSVRTVARSLDRLQKQGRIWRETSCYEPLRKAMGRTIYVISGLSVEDGARKLVRWCRTNGKKTSRTTSALCGLLLCYRQELEKWVMCAQIKGWLVVERTKGAPGFCEQYTLTRTNTAPYHDKIYYQNKEPRPILHFSEPTKNTTLHSRILRYFSTPLHTTETDQQIAEAIKSTPQSVRRHINLLCRSGKLSKRYFNKIRYLSTLPILDTIVPKTEPSKIVQCPTPNFKCDLKPLQENTDMNPKLDKLVAEVRTHLDNAGIPGVQWRRLNEQDIITTLSYHCDNDSAKTAAFLVAKYQSAIEKKRLREEEARKPLLDPYKVAAENFARFHEMAKPFIKSGADSVGVL